MYRTVAQLDSLTNLLATWFPAEFTRVALPQASVQGRTVYALRMRAGTSSGTRRGVLVVGGTHARELMNPDAVAELAVDLLVSYRNGTDIRYGGRTWAAADVKLIVEAMDLWLVPCINPDGREYVLTTDDMWRKNRRDNPGTPCDGVDLNRNSDFVWGVAQGQTSCSPCADTYCGPSAFSEPETRNVKHLLDTERIVSFVDVHSYSELVLYPWGHAPTQSSDPSQRFTGIPGGTCTASIPASYSEYMPPRDVQRFRTVADRIVQDVAQVRGRAYTPKTSLGLYATTGTQSDYAYSRHIANPSLQKTYGFTFETGPWQGNAADSFHPADPEPIKRDAKAAILALMQQSVCAIELIGSSLWSGRSELAALRGLRDQQLASTAAGRRWIGLFERLQFALLLLARQEPQRLLMAGEVLTQAARMLADESATFGAQDVKRALGLIGQLRSGVRIPALREDLAMLGERVRLLEGRSTRELVAMLMRRGPGAAGTRPGGKRPGGKKPGGKKPGGSKPAGKKPGAKKPATSATKKATRPTLTAKKKATRPASGGKK